MALLCIGPLEISGKIFMSGNILSDSASENDGKPLALASTELPITVGKLDPDSKIYISQTGVLSKGYSENNLLDPASIFITTIDGYTVKLENGEVAVVEGTQQSEQQNVYVPPIMFTPTGFTLTFNVGGGVALPSINAYANGIIKLENIIPTKADAEFEGWYSDYARTKPVTEVKLGGNTTIYAKWSDETYGPRGLVKLP